MITSTVVPSIYKFDYPQTNIIVFILKVYQSLQSIKTSFRLKYSLCTYTKGLSLRQMVSPFSTKTCTCLTTLNVEVLESEPCSTY